MISFGIPFKVFSIVGSARAVGSAEPIVTGIVVSATYYELATICSVSIADKMVMVCGGIGSGDGFISATDSRGNNGCHRSCGMCQGRGISQKLLV